MAVPIAKSREALRFQCRLAGVDVERAIRADRCAGCDGPATEFLSARSEREFTITGLCQQCRARRYEEQKEADDYRKDATDEERAAVIAEAMADARNALGATPHILEISRWLYWHRYVAFQLLIRAWMERNKGRGSVTKFLSQ
jgi:hypothetical protein